MSDVTAIEWTDATWNPVTGCTRVSPGCANCYIERTPPFRMAGRRFATVDGESTTGVTLHEDRLNAPLRWRKPRRVFVCSLADLFHDEIPYEYVRDVFNTMRCCDGGIVAATGRHDPSHIFQVLTKRPERVLELWRERKLGFTDWPPNVWLGVSIENARYTWRADVLREIPAAVRFISAEPLLGSLYPSEDSWSPQSSSATPPSTSRTSTPSTRPQASSPTVQTPAPSASARERSATETARLSAPSSRSSSSTPGSASSRRRAPLDLSGIDWVIVGGESGPGARPFHLEHAREIIAAARALDDRPAVFVKQLGAKPIDGRSHRVEDPRAGAWEWTLPLDLRDRKGGDMSEWPADLRIREFPFSPLVAA